jgi:hypothetical protein
VTHPKSGGTDADPIALYSIHYRAVKLDLSTTVQVVCFVLGLVSSRKITTKSLFKYGFFYSNLLL